MTDTECHMWVQTDETKRAHVIAVARWFGDMVRANHPDWRRVNVEPFVRISFVDADDVFGVWSGDMRESDPDTYLAELLSGYVYVASGGEIRHEGECS